MNFIIIGLSAFLFIVFIGYLFTIYNGLIAVRENIKKAWANIDVILKQRHDELPKVISVCQSYAEFEQGILTKVMRAREKYFAGNSVMEKAQASGEISAALKGIFALAENYPNLKTNETFQTLQERISHLEESLADRREFYNDSVNNYNIRIQSLPDAILASLMRLKQEQMFAVADEDMIDVDINIKLPEN
ncbi:MAG: LemA family protein [Desulfobulbaceae bacterium]|nr:LemA family protein [Desulfobulbaceae bacterium]